MRKHVVLLIALAALAGILCLPAAASSLGGSANLGGGVTVEVPVAEVDGQQFTDLAAALQSYNNSSEAQYIRLLAPVDSLDWALTQNVVLDLNGFTITANNTTGNYKLLVMDSQTDDYTVEDGNGYGSIPAGGNVKACDSYYQINEGENATFHRLDLNLTFVNLKLEQMGIYYTTQIGGDEKIKDIVKEFGVAACVFNAPNETSIFLDAEKKTRVAWDGSTWQTGETTGDNSVLISNIMKDNTYSAKLNGQRAEIPVWAACYIQTTDGKTLLGLASGYSLRDVVEAAQGNNAYKTQLEGLLDSYRGVMMDWDIPHVRGDRPVKILMIGQSHAQDSSWLVYEVLKAQMPDREFLVADTYKSTNLAEHVYNIQNEVPGYIYYEFTESGTYTKTKSFTINEAVVKHDWDLIVFNEATWPQVVGEHEYTDGDFDYFTNYIKEHATPGYKFAYNATWAQPVSAELYNVEAGRREPAANFRETYTSIFGGNRLTHFKIISKRMKDFVEVDPDYDLVLHSGTAIQYASETLGVAECDPTWTYELYRDYTHLGDFGRLLVAYQWYAQIFGLDKLETVEVDTIPENMRVPGATDKGDITITDDMRNAIIASVNYALKHPNEAPSQNRATPILEALPDETTQ